MLTYSFLSWPHALSLLLLHLLRLKKTLLLMQVITPLNLADHTKAKDLATALDILLACHQTELEDFSKEHNTKLHYIQKLAS
jgi:hypothetical protein